MRILFLEDDPIIADVVVEFLSEDNEVTHTYSSHEALTLADENSYSLFIFDINVVGMSGLELLKELRSFNNNTPTIFISAYQDISYLKKAFEIGANDFIRKPFEFDELQARIDNIKRVFSIDENIRIDDHTIYDQKMHHILKDNKIFKLAQKENALLQYMIKNKNRIISNDELLQNLWSYDEAPNSDAIRTYIKNLRSIIGKEHIVNVRALGYRFE